MISKMSKLWSKEIFYRQLRIYSSGLKAIIHKNKAMIQRIKAIEAAAYDKPHLLLLQSPSSVSAPHPWARLNIGWMKRSTRRKARRHTRIDTASCTEMQHWISIKHQVDCADDQYIFWVCSSLLWLQVKATSERLADYLSCQTGSTQKWLWWANTF